MRFAAPPYASDSTDSGASSSSSPSISSSSACTTKKPTPRNVYRAFPSLDSNDSLSSVEVEVIRPVVRKARHKSFQARDKARKRVKGRKSRRGRAGSSKSDLISPEGSSGPIKRSLTFIYNNFVPYFGNFNECPTPSGSFSNAPGAYPGSFTEPATAASASSSSSSGSERNEFDNYDSSFGDTSTFGGTYGSSSSPSSDDSSSTSINCSSSDLTSDEVHTPVAHTHLSYPRILRRGLPILSANHKHNWMDPAVQARYDRENAKMEKAKARTKEEVERKRKARRKELEEERAMRLQEAARFSREQSEINARIHAEKIARAEAFAKRHPNIKVEEDDSPPRLFGNHKPDNPHSQNASGGIKQEEEDTSNFYPRDPPKEQDYLYTRYRQPGSRAYDRTSRTRSSHQHFHPYASSAKPGSSASGRYFNPTDATPILALASSVDPLVAHFEWYKQQWRDISSLSSNSPLTFATIPWPILTIPRTLTDVSKTSVTEFMRHAMLGPHVATPKQVRREVMRQLKNWHSDKFNTRVLPRVASKAEREIILTAMDVVQKALIDLKSN